ncbi:hypothetical protein YSA_09920 [Pseudomonas putida ND6]|uniref:Uncharacterized protein n=1 Tax=Pseudomonas putida ND6 TaxID=231023 RepID=I3V337_PSEPU|nr:hypothetical protein YSA_09920 [Pseudomonas putida ND6]
MKRQLFACGQYALEPVPVQHVVNMHAFLRATISVNA